MMKQTEAVESISNRIEEEPHWPTSGLGDTVAPLKQSSSPCSATSATSVTVT